MLVHRAKYGTMGATNSRRCHVPASANPPVMSADEFERLFQRVRNWGRWGDDDQRGALNLIGPAQRRAAAALVREGAVVSCAHPLNTVPEIDNGNPALHFMLRSGDAGPDVTSHADFIGIAPHGHSHTHLDALCHFFYQGQMYNGRPISDVKSTGAHSNSIHAAAVEGVVTRGVLLDVARSRGGEWLEPGDTVTVAELEAAEATQGVKVGQGDVMLVRTGRTARRARLGPWDTRREGIAALHPTTAAFMHERGVAVMSTDGGNDTGTLVCEAHRSPVHVLCLVAMGVWILDNARLEELAAACQQRNRWEFLFMMAPLRLELGTSSPVNPLAVF